ncbi:hypothetical protein AB833_18495 [Chromatiales bacterium (ex Bugula neritina AB1)]|nr:hypothetical protein AB833_18495 [Chromatiales bacterium (ex Bugula neritina AB1)]
MQEASYPGVRKAVLILFAAGVIIAMAGAHHRNARIASQVTWQDVSKTLQSVEVAKRDLFHSMQVKSAKP